MTRGGRSQGLLRAAAMVASAAVPHNQTAL